MSFSHIVLFLFTANLFFFSCKNHTPTEFKNIARGEALGTTYAITFLSNEPLRLKKEIDSVFHVINQSMSTYQTNSDISKINNGDSTLVVDHMFKDVYAISKKTFATTNGYFDPTVGILVDAWGFGPGTPIQLLDSIKVDSLLQFVGFNKVSLLPNGTIRKQHPNIRFDFNAVAKGYAIDRLAVMLKQKGINDFLVEVGGEIYASGINSITKKPWLVGVDNPHDTETRGSAVHVTLTNKALASSGNYRHFRIDSLTGTKYVHTINPLTGFSKNASVLAATVTANDCATADAYATAFMAMNLPDSKKLLEDLTSIEAFIIYDEGGATQSYMTSGFENLVIK